MSIYNDEYMFHTGVKGMKWGKRTVSNIKEGFKAQTQAQKDQLLHPIHSTKAQLNMLRKNPLRTMAGGTKVLQELNADVAKRVDKSKQQKAEKKSKTAEEHITKGAETTVKLLQTLKAANEKNQNQKRADELRKNGSGTSAAVTEFANNVAYKAKTNRIWDK